MMGVEQLKNPMSQFEEIGKQNIEMFGKAMEAMFNPFGASTDDKKK